MIPAYGQLRDDILAKLLAQNVTSADVLDSTSLINTQAKQMGRSIFDSGRMKPLWAAGPAPSDNWLDATGAVVASPYNTYQGWDMALDFRNGSYRSGATTTRDITQAPGYSYARNGGAKYEDSGNGVLLPYAANVPAIIPGVGFMARTGFKNILRNSLAQGATAGSPGSVPGWTGIGNNINGTGISTTVQAIGTEPVTGAQYVDIRIAGTNGGSTTSNYGFSAQQFTDNDQNVVQGDYVTFSAYAAIVAGSIAGFAAVPRMSIDEYNSTGTYLSGGGLNLPSIVGGGNLTRQTLIRSMPSATAAKYAANILGFVGPGSTVDVTIRIMLPQLGKAGSAGPILPTNNTALNSIGGDLLNMTQQVPQDEDGFVILRYNALFAAGYAPQQPERPLGINDGTSANRGGFERESSGRVNYSGVPSLQTVVQAAAGRLTVAARRRSGKTAIAMINAAGTYGLGPEATVAFASGKTLVNIGQAFGSPQVNSPVEFYGYRRGTYTDAQVQTMMQAIAA